MFPHAAAFIPSNLETEEIKKGQSFKPCVVGKAIPEPFQANTQDPRKALDAVSTDNKGPITPQDIE